MAGRVSGAAAAAPGAAAPAAAHADGEWESWSHGGYFPSG